jgi:hypothetical protein
MKTIIKILIAAAIINGAVRVGMAEAGYYQLRDASQELVTFGSQLGVGDLQNRILTKAKELNLPIDASAIDVQRDGSRTIVKTAYTQPVEVFPNYIYPMTFQFSVEALSMGGLGSNTPGQAK